MDGIMEGRNLQERRGEVMEKRPSGHFDPFLPMLLRDYPTIQRSELQYQAPATKAAPIFGNKTPF